MRLVVFAAALAACSTTALAADGPQASCIDPGKSYVARPLNNHDAFVQQTLGKAKPPIRLKTSCINLESAITIGLSAQFICIGLGDRVVATTIDGTREGCVVTRVLPYAPEAGDPEKQ